MSCGACLPTLRDPETVACLKIYIYTASLFNVKPTVSVACVLRGVATAQVETFDGDLAASGSDDDDNRARKNPKAVSHLPTIDEESLGSGDGDEDDAFSHKKVEASGEGDNDALCGYDDRSVISFKRQKEDGVKQQEENKEKEAALQTENDEGDDGGGGYGYEEYYYSGDGGYAYEDDRMNP